MSSSQSPSHSASVPDPAQHTARAISASAQCHQDGANGSGLRFGEKIGKLSPYGQSSKLPFPTGGKYVLRPTELPEGSEAGREGQALSSPFSAHSTLSRLDPFRQGPASLGR